MERLPSALLRKRSTLVTGPGVPGQYLAQPGLAFPLLVSKGLLLLFKHPPHPLVSRPTRPPPWMSLAWSGNPSSLPCQVLCLTPLWLRILEWASSVRSVRQKPVRSVPEVFLSQTLNLVAWRCALCLLCSQRVRRKQECVPDLSWLEGRARPSLITPQYGSPDHHAACSQCPWASCPADDNCRRSWWSGLSEPGCTPRKAVVCISGNVCRNEALGVSVDPKVLGAHSFLWVLAVMPLSLRSL